MKFLFSPFLLSMTVGLSAVVRGCLLVEAGNNRDFPSLPMPSPAPPRKLADRLRCGAPGPQRQRHRVRESRCLCPHAAPVHLQGRARGTGGVGTRAGVGARGSQPLFPPPQATGGGAHRAALTLESALGGTGVLPCHQSSCDLLLAAPVPGPGGGEGQAGPSPLSPSGQAGVSTEATLQRPPQHHGPGEPDSPQKGA